jgi:hypothetical protein
MSGTPVQSGIPGHDNGTAFVRRKPVRIDDDGMIRQGYTELWEVVCPACGDPITVNYEDAVPEIRMIRGPYQDQHTASVALMIHVGFENDETRAAREVS